ncbi:MAG: M15 family metallopeptidase [Deltaproteobacteria bacterium]|nr:M15 family metallopeptidase [Deltaproteobacteria bacterium]MBI3295357.1 M15 family metallopeptidase [Deltaproteobacteria bacterium]
MGKLKDTLTGRSRDHVIQFENTHAVIHRDVESPLKNLKQKAREAGFDLAIASSFRDYNSQLNIWNLKSLGKRPVLDSAGNPLSVPSMKPEELVFAILRWSALPGCSRHHWGTEIDVFDRNSLPKDYQVQLIPKEAAPGGIFARFNDWLDTNISGEGFFRPYSKDKGGVSPEWWHLSYAPVSQRYFEQFDLSLCQNVIKDSAIELKDTVLQCLPDIYSRFISNISLPDTRSV